MHAQMLHENIQKKHSVHMLQPTIPVQWHRQLSVCLRSGMRVKLSVNFC